QGIDGAARGVEPHPRRPREREREAGAEHEDGAAEPQSPRRLGRRGDRRLRGSYGGRGSRSDEGFERGGELPRGGEPVLRALGETGGDQALERLGNPRPERREGNGLLADD